MQLCSSLSILWHCFLRGLEWKLTFLSPVATAEFSKFAGILSAALSQYHLSEFEIAPEVTGKFGLGVQNEVWQRLIEFCQENVLAIANILFQHHKRRLYTWASSDQQYQNQIDYILCSQRCRSFIHIQFCYKENNCSKFWHMCRDSWRRMRGIGRELMMTIFLLISLCVRWFLCKLKFNIYSFVK